MFKTANKDSENLSLGPSINS